MKKPLLAFFIILTLSLSGCIVYLLATRASSGQPDHAAETGNSGSHRDRRSGETETPLQAGEKTKRQRPADPAGKTESIDILEAGRLLAQFKATNSDMIDQAEFAAELIERMCKSGNTDDAWDFIDPNPGQARNMQFREFFKHADLDRSELLARLSAGEFDFVVQQGLTGYLMRHKASDVVNELRSPEVAALTANLDRNPEEVIYWAMEAVRCDYYGRRELEKNIPEESVVRDFLDTLSTLHSEDKLNRNHFLSLLAMSAVDDFTKWEFIKKQVATSGPGKDPMIERAVEKMVFADPERALTTVLAEPSALANGTVYTAVRSWLGADTGSALKWYSQNQAGLPVSQQSALASAFADSELVKSNFDSARQWADQIRDPQVKADRLRAIAEKEAAASAGTP